MSNLYADSTHYRQTFSKWGYELTIKLQANTIEDVYFALNMLGNLAHYTFSSSRYFKPYDYILGNREPIKQGSDSKLASLLVVVEIVHGTVSFLQLVGITYDDALLINEALAPWEMSRKLLASINPDLVTDLSNTKRYL